ncbi:MAG: GAF domain-containing protein [Calditrichaeota bacterium]|nr:GAF domain-containing protein [Calditrichota bacterium]
MKEFPVLTYRDTIENVKIKRGDIKTKAFDGSLQELYDSYLRYRILYEMARLVTSETTIENILNTILDKLIDFTGAERSLVLIFDKSGEIIYHAGRELDQNSILDPKFEVSWSIINKTRQSGEPVCLRNALEGPDFDKSKSIFRLKILSVICVPIVHKSDVIGVLYADNRTVQGIFKSQVSDFLYQCINLISSYMHALLQRKELLNGIDELEKQIRSRGNYQAIIGVSPQIKEVIKFIGQVADSNATVLIEGASGTGKELVARALHDNSSRKDKPFVSLNCGALPETLLESELFGYAKGAFTGATQDKKGWFETANGGTIFFDEISEMSPALQVKLLRILQNGEYSPVGNMQIKKCSVRIVAATNAHLEDLVKQKKFRADLFYRLNILNVELSSLKERREDILMLAEYFLRQYGKQLEKNDLKLSEEVKEILLKYDFPGNVRELENAMHRTAVLAQEDEVQVRHLPDAMRLHTTLERLKAPGHFAREKVRMIEQFEKNYIESALKNAKGVVAQAARLAGMDAKNFYQKMEKYNINPKQFKLTI